MGQPLGTEINACCIHAEEMRAAYERISQRITSDLKA